MDQLKLPSYQGLYRRAFLPPLMVVSVGLWGSKAVARFFRYMEDAFGCQDIEACFARVAVIRDGVADYETTWNPEIVTWPEITGHRFELCADIQTQDFWTPSRSSFEAATDLLYSKLAPVLTRQFAWLSVQDGWRKQARDAGFTVPAIAQNPQHWVIVAGNLFEPEVASVLIRFVDEFRKRVPVGNVDLRFLLLADFGLPDEPEEHRTPWIDLPGWLAEQALQALDRFDTHYPGVAYLLGHMNRAGRMDLEHGRVAMAAGILRAIFCSELLDSRLAWHSSWNQVSIVQAPSDVGSERVGHFIEFALDAENLAAVVAHEVLARWRKRIEHDPVEIETDVVKQRIVQALSNTGSVQQVVSAWLEAWTERGLTRSAAAQFEQVLSWAKEEQALDDTEFDRVSTLASNQLAQPLEHSPKTRWDWLKRFRGKAQQLTPPDYASDAAIIKRRMSKREELCGWLKFGLEFANVIYRDDGMFQDTIYDTHYAREQWDSRTVLVQLRRLPLSDDCPPAIQNIVSELTKKLPENMRECASQSSCFTSFLDQLQQEIERCFTQILAAGDSDRRWSTCGFAQWLATDPQLARLVANAIAEDFVVPWKPNPGHFWQGHLAVLSYEVPGHHDTYNANRNAWERLALELKRRDPEGQPIIGSAAPVMSELNPDADIVWVRWPQVFSLGLFWFESSIPGERFATAVDRESLSSIGQQWVREHRQDELLISFSLPQQAVDDASVSTDS